MSLARIEVAGEPRFSSLLIDLSSPSVVMALLCGAQVAFWTIAPIIANDALPLDVAENGAWGPEWIISSYKNPALSSWVLELARLATGSLSWSAYLVSQLFVSATFLFVFLLGREGLGAPRALAGTLLLTAVYYFSWPTPEFNQDIAQMPLWAGVALALWRASETNRWSWWILLAVFSAASLYAKLSSGVLLITGAGWLLLDPQTRPSLASARPWIALVLFLALVAPLGHWLIDSGFEPASYAVARGSYRSFSGLGFLLAQLEALAPALIVLWLSGLLGGPKNGLSHGEERFGHYLLVLTIVPLLLCVLSTTIAHTGARRMWGVPMLNLVGLLAVWATSPRFNQNALRRIQIAACILLTVLPVAYVAVTAGAPWVGYVKRQNWPQAKIATRMREIWTQSTGEPLRIVAGGNTNWLAGLIATACCEQPPSLFTDADQARSPWITDERLAREGALVVWASHGDQPSQRTVDLIGGRPRLVAHFSVPQASSEPPMDVNYAIVPPRVGP